MNSAKNGLNTRFPVYGRFVLHLAYTFCSNMAKSGMNPKTLQYIMGHADISVTLNTYTHVNFDDAKEEVYRIANS